MREQGPVEMLCREIDFRFVRHIERPEIFIAFVSALIDTVGDMRESEARISEIPGVVKTSHPAPSDDSAEVLRRCRDLIALCNVAKHPQTLIDGAAEVHNFIHEVAPDHLIDMLSSCVSAIRFGLETPCRSRHAAAAASHIWRKRYGLTLEDEHTPRWSKDWTRTILQDCINGLALRSIEAAA